MSDHRKLLQTVEAAQAAGDHQRAVAILDAAVEVDPEDAPLRLARARSLDALGRPTAMLHDLEVAFSDEKVAASSRDELWLDRWRDHPRLVLASGADPTLDEGLEAIRTGASRQALKLLPIDGPFAAASRFLRGIAHSELGDHAAALGEADALVALLPDCGDGWFNRGCALEVLDRHALAVDAYRRATAVAPDHSNAWYNLALLLRRLARLDESREAFAAGVAADPRSPLLSFGLGEALALATDVPGAEAELRRATTLDDAVPEAIAASRLLRETLPAEVLARLRG